VNEDANVDAPEDDLDHMTEDVDDVLDQKANH